MVESRKIYQRSWRTRKAFGTTFRVMLSYFWLYILSRFLGENFRKKRLKALHLKNATRIKKTIIELQGLFVKVGQSLSILTNFLPQEFQEVLEGLQDKVPARPYSIVENRLQSEWDPSLFDQFESISKEPLAAASIGQTHRATLLDGTQVVLKVQHHNIEKVAEIDLDIMRKLTDWLSWWMDIKGLDYAFGEVKKMIEEELDFRKEAQSMQIIAANLKEEEGVSVPGVYPEFSTKRILCMDYCEGVKISNLSQIDVWNLPKTQLAERLVHAYCQMVFVDGFYHADPHPGNVLVQKDGTIVLLDFGAVATLRKEMRQGLLQLLEGAVKNDTEKIIDALMELGFIADEKAAIQIAEKVIDALRNFLQNEVQFDGLNFKDIQVNPFETSLFQLITDIGLKGIAEAVQVPRDYVLLNRMVTLLIGISSNLDPQMNPMEVVQPYFRQFVMGDAASMVDFAKDFLSKTVSSLVSIPADFQKVLHQVKRGQLEIRLEGQVQQSKLIFHLVWQILYVLGLIGGAGLGYLFYKNGDDYLLNFLPWIGGFILILLLRSLLKTRKILRTS